MPRPLPSRIISGPNGSKTVMCSVLGFPVGAHSRNFDSHSVTLPFCLTPTATYVFAFGRSRLIMLHSPIFISDTTCLACFIHSQYSYSTY
ncbi:hypothetical protein VNO78_26663 [Psophocarpus tetragonolobus]|uniref:Uncharacterized protein n=1 Tax=Psophocarpus tetragonolobus TaxID=3891 RepID=A0AAN9S2A0_PSOTE